MKETRFIAQNKEKWLESENLLKDTSKDPEKLNALFTQVVDDLSYSRTFYQNRSVRVYLNKIAREYFSIIYSHQKEKGNRFKLFWTEEMPQVIIHCRKPLLISLVVFLLSMSIGIFSSMQDPHFSSAILGEGYVAMTKANIEKGDPMAVYKQGHQVQMFLGITFNNLLVAFRTYVSGIFLSIGTLALLLSNGIMVGCFQYFFVEHGLLGESALTIWQHGTLEISSIILAGGAGLTLGSGLIFPGTYSRLQAFQLSAMRSLKLMLGISPVFVIAAIIESFLTRYTETPTILRVLLIIISAGFIVGYFVIYPWMKSKAGFSQPLDATKLAPSNLDPVNFAKIKTNAEILKDAFILFKRNTSKILPWSLLVSIGLAAVNFLQTREIVEFRYTGEWWQYFISGIFYALDVDNPIAIAVGATGSAILVCRMNWILTQEHQKSSTTVLSFLQALFIMTLLYWLISLGWGILFALLSFGWLFMWVYTFTQERSNMIQGFGRAWSLASSNLGQLIGLEFVLLLMSFCFLLIMYAPLLYIYLNVFQWNFAKNDVWAKEVVYFIEIFIKYLAFNLVLPIVVAAMSYLYYSLKEIQSAANLQAMIAQVGTRSVKGSKR